MPNLNRHPPCLTFVDGRSRTAFLTRYLAAVMVTSSS